MPAIHFESVYRTRDQDFWPTGSVTCEPLCGPEREPFEASPRWHEVTCQFCLKLLMSAKEYQ